MRAQTRSVERPEFDGAFFRAFDFDKHEVWGSDADAGGLVFVDRGGRLQAVDTRFSDGEAAQGGLIYVKAGAAAKWPLESVEESAPASPAAEAGTAAPASSER